MRSVDLTLDEIIAEMDELGRTKFHAAQLAATNRKLVARITELEAAEETTESSL